MSPPLLAIEDRVRYSDLGPRDEASPAAICGLMQEAAMLHAQELGVSMDAFLPRGWTWMLARLHTRFAHFPAWREKITVETWPSELFGLYAMRQYRLSGEDGRELAIGSSSWVVIEIERRRPLRRIPEELKAFHSSDPVRVLPRKPPRLPAFEDAELTSLFQVRRSDLDGNGHLNHVAIVSKLTQTVPPDVWETWRLAEMVVEFKAEVLHGETLVSRSRSLESPGEFLHSMLREHDGQEAARARTSWSLPSP